MEYKIKFAPDAIMPTDDMWLFCRTDDRLTLFIRESVEECTTGQKEHFLEEMWCAFRALEAGKIPEQRAYSRSSATAAP